MKKWIALALVLLTLPVYAGGRKAVPVNDECEVTAMFMKGMAQRRDRGEPEDVQLQEMIKAGLVPNGEALSGVVQSLQLVYGHPEAVPQEFYNYALGECRHQKWREAQRAKEL